MRKILAILLAMLLLTGLLAGCGGGNDTPTEIAAPEVEVTAPEEPEEDAEASEAVPEAPASGIDPRLVGIWLWDEHSAYEYNFFEDGTGTRGAELLDEITEFTWSVTVNLYLVIETETEIERWDYDINVDRLTLTSRQIPGTQYSYTRLGITPRI